MSRFGLPRVRFGWRRLAASVAIAVWIVALGVVAFAIYNTQGDGRRQLEQRFAIRADLASRFVETYAAEVLTRERAQATTQLAKPRVAAADFNAVVVGGGYQAAVLLDARGRLLQVAPAKPELLGKQVGNLYPHLRSALNGKAAVSPVVPSAADGAPVVGFADALRHSAGPSRLEQRIRHSAEPSRGLPPQRHDAQAERGRPRGRERDGHRLEP